VSSQVSTAPRGALNARQVETVERLLSAGAEELRAVGHDALTIRTVATRARVSPATAYTYLASKNHLFAELFWRHLAEQRDVAPAGRTPLERVQGVTRQMTRSLAEAPELAAAATSALLSTDPNVERLRIQIGSEFVDRFTRALGDVAEPALVETLVLALSGALLQGGMGLLTYTEMGERLDSVVAVIMKGHA
jgi:AcrR family transcriptional regulator